MASRSRTGSNRPLVQAQPRGIYIRRVTVYFPGCRSIQTRLRHHLGSLLGSAPEAPAVPTIALAVLSMGPQMRSASMHRMTRMAFACPSCRAELPDVACPSLCNNCGCPIPAEIAQAFERAERRAEKLSHPRAKRQWPRQKLSGRHIRN
jgi:hypothetical protein